MSDDYDRFSLLARDINAFANARDWQRLHETKSLLLALVGEVGEVAEIIQWFAREEMHELSIVGSPHREHLREELADVLIYLIELAAHVDVDLLEAAEQKLVKNASKHPIPDAGNRD